MKIKLLIFFIITFLSFNSCDILRFSKFEVTSWAPGEGFHSEPEKIEVSLCFSHEPNRSSVERNFSLTANGNTVRGTFHWNGKKVIFSPLTPLEANTDFILSLSADANNTDGLSLDNSFNCNFSTRPDNTHPVLVAYSPSLYEEVSNPRTEVRLEFSIPVPLKTIQDNVSFTPSMSGLWVLYNDGKLAVFTPSEPWQKNINYEIRFSASLTDNNGVNIGNDFLSVFTTKTDHEIPYLLYARRIKNENERILLTQSVGFSENYNWEKDDKLSLVFSEPVDSTLVKNYLISEDGPSPVMETLSGFHEEFIFYFENKPIYESRFTLRIKPGIKDNAGNESKEEYVYRIFANGKNSKPPLLMGIRIPMALNNETDLEPIFYGNDSLFEIIPILEENYPSGESVSTWIELYFSLAEGASVDLFSLMDLFRTDTSNNVLNFSPRYVKTNNFTIDGPHPGCEEFQRIEVMGNLTNTTDYGIVIFQIASGLKDSFGNTNDKTQKISLLK